MTNPDSDAVKNHSIIAKVFHWGFIIVFLYALSKQLANVDELADAALLRFEVVFAIGFLILLGVRFVYMHKTQPTALPDNTSKRMKLLARLGHLSMYISLAMIAISGLLIGAIYSAGGLSGFGMDAAVGFHELSILATFITIGLHIAAAFYHRLKGDGIWTAMVPVWKEDNNKTNNV